MAIWGWISDNAFNLITGIGVIAGLSFSAASRRDATRNQQTANLLSITANHRELWKIYLDRRDLTRVRDHKADLGKQQVTEEERVFVNLVVQHANSVYRALNDHLLINIEGFKSDIAQFFALPIVSSVWKRIKPLQNEDFVRFVDECRRTKATLRQ